MIKIYLLLQLTRSTDTEQFENLNRSHEAVDGVDIDDVAMNVPRFEILGNNYLDSVYGFMLI